MIFMVFDVDQYIRKSISGQTVFSLKKSLSTSQITDELLLIDQALKHSNVLPKMRKRIFYVAVESIQNLYHHKLPSQYVIDDLSRLCWFFISELDDSFCIITGNFIKDAEKEGISKHIEKINSLNGEELKELYSKVLTNKEFSPKGGGGLGMIDIARKANGLFVPEFIPYKDGITFFKLEITINQK